MANEKQYTLNELACETRISPRNIRYYISRNLLPGPDQVGRNSVYTEKHLARLMEIQKLKSSGMLLGEIVLAQAGSKSPLPEPRAVLTFTVSDDVSILVDAGVSPWRMKQIRKAISEMIPIIQTERRK